MSQLSIERKLLINEHLNPCLLLRVVFFFFLKVKGGKSTRLSYKENNETTHSPQYILILLSRDQEGILVTRVQRHIQQEDH